MQISINQEEFAKSFADFLQQEENTRLRKGCFIEDTLAMKVQDRLSREAYLWDKEVSWALRQSENLGKLTLSIAERDPIGSSIVVFDIPGTHGPHLMYGKNFSLPQNPYLAEQRRKEVEVHGSPLEENVHRYQFHDSNRDDFLHSLNASGLEIGLPRLKTKWAFVECPSMIMDPRALLEVHTTLSKNCNLIVFQAYHPDDVTVRESNLTKAHEHAATWGLPQLKEYSELKLPQESQFRKYDSEIVSREHASFL